ncbi:mitochondrial fission ELM1 family protein [Roseospira visakhapatnamensis]|uniref:Mitochondrial fission protein ELM1 n=1 Tax=Roseospira visakhapatnamensis TaxID=390880 RepID=A0A7W6W873_9PROT|nr:mitochondrial fission ELM1 family protein [Roseospira visakhapatnamensis]MBB4264544.1 hypothetical protein [Roseospira visakhapatnamensis]
MIRSVASAPCSDGADAAHPATVPVVWALVDRLVGSANQARGVATALGLPTAEQPLEYAREWPWDRLARHVVLAPETRARVLASASAPHGPPRLVISCGRRAGAAARWIRGALAAGGGRPPRLLHMQDPRVGHGDFDLIAVPSHDRAVARLRRRSNVLVVLGAPHALTPARLTAEAARWREAVAALPRPWITVLVGGDSGRRRLDAGVAVTLAGQARALAARAGGSLLVTTSRRTRPDAVAAIRAGLAGVPHVLHPWTPDRAANPYLGFLGLADAVVVTGDSISMLTEATTTGRPLYVASPPGWARGPHARYHAALIQAGAARPLRDGTPWSPWSATAVNPAGQIAAAARALLAADGLEGDGEGDGEGGGA